MGIAEFTRKYGTQLWSFSSIDGFGGQSFIFNLTNSSQDFFSHRMDPINQRIKTSFWEVIGDPLRVKGAPGALEDQILIRDLENGKKFLAHSFVLSKDVSKLLPYWVHVHQHYENENDVKRTHLLAAAERFKPIKTARPNFDLLAQEHGDKENFDTIMALWDANGPAAMFDYYLYQSFNIGNKDPIKFFSSYENFEKAYFKLFQFEADHFVNPVIDKSIPITLKDMRDGEKLFDKLPLLDLNIEAYNTRAAETALREENMLTRFKEAHPALYKHFKYAPA